MGQKLGPDGARTALRQLQTESPQRIEHYVGADCCRKYFPVMAKGPGWKVGNPRGVVDHYTASLKLAGTLNWFSTAHPEANVSVHFVVDRDGTAVVLVDPLSEIAWHAKGFNSTYIGIEHINAGILKNDKGSYLFMDKFPYPADRGPNVQFAKGYFWEPYTSHQLATNIVLKRWLVEAIPTLSRENFTDHHRLDPQRKTDCGPLWPLDALNTLVFSWQDGFRFSWAGKELVTLQDISTLTQELNKET